MASIQCYKPVEQTCSQAQYSSTVKSETQCTSKTDTYYTDHGVAKTKSAHCYSQTQGNDPNHTQTHCTDQNKAHGIGIGIGIGGHTHTQSHSTDQNKAHGIGVGVGIGLTHSSNGTGASACHKKRGERKHRSLIQRIKDGISGDNSSSSSSSDSESDDERCGKPKPTC